MALVPRFSNVIAATISAQSSSRPNRASAVAAIPSAQGVPLIRHSPSLAPSVSGVRPSRSRASAAGMISPRNDTVPSPMTASAIWAIWVR